MNEWIDPAKRLPKDGQHVDILISDRIVEQVLFQDGFFWRFRIKGAEGHPYMVLSWRPSEKQVKKGGRLHASTADSLTTSAENTD